MTRRELLAFAVILLTLPIPVRAVQSASIKSQEPRAGVATKVFLDRLSEKLIKAEFSPFETSTQHPGHPYVKANYNIVGLLSVAEAQHKTGNAAGAKAAWSAAKAKAQTLLGTGQPSSIAEVAVVASRLGYVQEAEAILTAMMQMWKAQTTPELRILFGSHIAYVQASSGGSATASGKEAAKKTLSMCLSDLESVFQLQKKGLLLLDIAEAQAKTGDHETAVKTFVAGLDLIQKVDHPLSAEATLEAATPLILYSGKDESQRMGPLVQRISDLIAKERITDTAITLACTLARLQHKTGDTAGARATLGRVASRVEENRSSSWVNQRMIIGYALADTGDKEGAKQAAKKLWGAQPVRNVGFEVEVKRTFPIFSIWPGLAAARLHFRLDEFETGVAHIRQLKEATRSTRLLNEKILRETVLIGILQALSTGTKEALPKLNELLSPKTLSTAEPLDRKILLEYAKQGEPHIVGDGEPMFLTLLYAESGRAIAKKGDIALANSWFDKALEVVPVQWLDRTYTQSPYPLEDFGNVHPVTELTNALIGR